MTIDAHQHFWEPARGDYGWLVPESPLCRPWLPDDLKPFLDGSGVTGTILVQAAPTVAETEYLLSLAKATDWILGVVGWVDLAADDAVAQITERAANPLFVGVRPMLQDMTDRQWILNTGLAPALTTLAANHIVLDALVRIDQLATILTLASRHADLTIVLDHAGKPPFGNRAAMTNWHIQMYHFAALPNLVCKLSGLMTELPVGASLGEVDDAIDTLIELFGPHRLLWGSDWPVATAATSYNDWFARCRDRIPVSYRDAILGGNAHRIYALADAGRSNGIDI